LWAFRNNAQDVYDLEINRYIQDPSGENFVRLLAHTFDHNTSNLISRAGDQMAGWLATESQKLFSPIVRRHLEKIHDSLLLEYVEQEKHDQKSLARLAGIAEGGESQACIALRIQAENIQNVLAGQDLSNWREILGPFLP
jgi:hypothetical protein